MNYPHIINNGVQLVREEMVPPLMALRYIRIIALKLVCYIYTPHVASIMKVHGAGLYFLMFIIYFLVKKLLYAWS